MSPSLLGKWQLLAGNIDLEYVSPEHDITAAAADSTAVEAHVFDQEGKEVDPGKHAYTEVENLTLRDHWRSLPVTGRHVPFADAVVALQAMSALASSISANLDEDQVDVGGSSDDEGNTHYAKEDPRQVAWKLQMRTDILDADFDLSVKPDWGNIDVTDEATQKVESYKTWDG